MWVGHADWRIVSIVDSFWVDAEYDTVLVRLPGTMRAIGMGREIHALHCCAQELVGVSDDTTEPTEKVCTHHRGEQLTDYLADDGHDRGSHLPTAGHCKHVSGIARYRQLCR